MTHDGGCCTPQRAEAVALPLRPMRLSALRPAPADECEVPSGSFVMGDAFGEGYPDDGEGPAHEVEVSGFRIDAEPVTVARFARFVEATGYATVAERLGGSAVFHAFVAEGETILGRSEAAPWWWEVAGATWRHPSGPLSAPAAEDHPVTQVAFSDAVSYCLWAGRRLPTEAEWEYAARGGLASARYAWGDELTPGGEHRCNIWQGSFPARDDGDDGFVGTSPVGSFPANGFGLHDVAGNVWEWCQDWFAADYYSRSSPRDPMGPTSGEFRVMRGGSHLCHESYCNRYRVSARSASAPDSTAGNLGFRTVAL
ncbi:formylglycine-generating enzyme family protein [Microbacterium sp. NPDC057944]|uniref:formylglycine-generating enzyme family protein n=1 Tax=Microbacterium sp. NPDC057944 TaxID=3346286 RepID=UPI0036D8DF89